MKLSIKTTKLQEMVSRAVKGASNNKLIPLTSLMAIELNSSKLTLITTDATNYLYVIEDKVVGEDFYVVVAVDTFAKLISRMTSENVSLELKENSLEVIGNGTYNIELPLDENGELIKYPDPAKDFSSSNSAITVNLSVIKTILNSVKPSLAITLENPCYTGYYVGDKIVATDSFKIASMDVNLFNTNVLISPEMMNLLDVMTDEKISVSIQDNIIAFITDNCVVYGNLMEGIEDYEIVAISGLLDTKFGSVCKLPKSALLQVLDRLSLFVGTYDKNGIRLTFTKEGLQISSKAANGVELIEYVESKKFKEFTCLIDIEMWTQQIKAQATDVIELHYGLDNAVKMVDGNITQITALLEENESE